MHAQENVPSAVVHASAERVNVNGESFFEVTAIGFARATPQQAWRVLTDYERLAEFVPDLVSSTLLSRSGHQVLVEQYSRAGFLFVAQTVHLLVRIDERPFVAIDVALMSGDMRHYAAHWELEPVEHGTRIRFSGAMEPDFFVPPLIGRPIVQANVKTMVEAVVAEIERRSAH